MPGFSVPQPLALHFVDLLEILFTRHIKTRGTNLHAARLKINFFKIGVRLQKLKNRISSGQFTNNLPSQSPMAANHVNAYTSAAPRLLYCQLPL